MNSSHAKFTRLGGLLDKLRENRRGWLPASHLSDKLCVGAAQIKAAIEDLGHQGYEIEAHPQLGYRLITEPETLIAKELTLQHPTAGIGCVVVVEGVAESTMASAWELATRGARHGTTVFAEEQTRGRGRLGRIWVGSRGRSLLLSIILRPKENSGPSYLVVMAAAIALAKVIRRAAGLRAQIQWPNDMVLGGKKVGGLLLEAKPAVSPEAWVLGVGLNVNETPENFPPDLVPSATSLRIAAGKPLARSVLARAVLMELGIWYETFERNDLHAIEAAWTELSSTLGKRVRIAQGDMSYTGRVLGLSPLEGLLVQLTKGGLKTFQPEFVSLELEAD